MDESVARDKTARAYSRIANLREELRKEKDSAIHERYVREYHGALDHLRDAGHDIEEFRIPDEEMEHRLLSSSPSYGHRYSEERYVEQAFILSKMGAVLTYFDVMGSGQTIGFRA